MRGEKKFFSSSWENNAEIAHTRPREKVINRDTRTKVEEQTKKALPIKKNSRTENGTTCSFTHFFCAFAQENWLTALSDGFGSCQKAATRERWLFSPISQDRRKSLRAATFFPSIRKKFLNKYHRITPEPKRSGSTVGDGGDTHPFRAENFFCGVDSRAQTKTFSNSSKGIVSSRECQPEEEIFSTTFFSHYYKAQNLCHKRMHEQTDLPSTSHNGRHEPTARCLALAMLLVGDLPYGCHG